MCLVLVELKIKLLSNIIVSRLASTPNVQAVYIDTLGTYNPALLQSLLPDSSDPSVLDRIHLMTALNMVSLVEACEQIKQSLSQMVPIELLVIDTISSPVSLVMNKGQLQGTPPLPKQTLLMTRSRIDAIVQSSSSIDNYTIQSHYITH